MFRNRHKSISPRSQANNFFLNSVNAEKLFTPFLHAETETTRVTHIDPWKKKSCVEHDCVHRLGTSEKFRDRYAIVLAVASRFYPRARVQCACARQRDEPRAKCTAAMENSTRQFSLSRSIVIPGGARDSKVASDEPHFPTFYR